ncbi:hypothetical protein FE410_05265 [Leuconostoc carnosum]|uniref:hypothetical protein n=1 Tax=Leuconostoc TaxID=1243 RepID=UPI00123BA588|nr:hypothetical protein [Leuconostoc carnosum]KAA8371100.1 hypothetical protein FE414_05260 [Leuconostoc carnosum]KAA8382741.1 hypothetical protein FE410_05265 [Leuconostoc carnosum]
MATQQKRAPTKKGATLVKNTSKQIIKTTKSDKKKIHIGVYLTNHKNKTIELPVNPSDIAHEAALSNETKDISAVGEVNLIGGQKLREYEFSFLIPRYPKKTNYTTAEKIAFADGVEYIKFIRNWQDSKKPGRILVTSGYMNLSMTVTSFKWAFVNGFDGEWVATIKLTEYRKIEFQKIAKKKSVNKSTPKKGQQRPRPAKKIGIGSIVFVSGQLHRDSYGSGAGQTEKNAKRKINFVAPGRKYPYHVTTLSGGWRGWVSKNAVKSV